MTNKLLVAAAASLFLMGVAQAAFYHVRLPDRVASHFDASGEPDGFSSKTTHTVMMIGLQLGMLLMFLVLGLCCKYLPASLINIPNREYWLAPERRPSTTTTLNTALYSLAIATQLFLMGINQLIIWHNLGFAGMASGWFWGWLGVYILGTAVMCIWLLLKFRMPTNVQDA